jgi:hypothetical protein
LRSGAAEWRAVFEVFEVFEVFVRHLRRRPQVLPLAR